MDRRFNLKAEAEVLGAVIKENKLIHDIYDFLLPEDFYDNKNKLIYSAIRVLQESSTPITIVTLIETLKEIVAIYRSYINHDNGNFKATIYKNRYKLTFRVLREPLKFYLSELNSDNVEKIYSHIENIQVTKKERVYGKDH